MAFDLRIGSSAGSTRHLLCDVRGVPLAFRLTGAKRNDSQEGFGGQTLEWSTVRVSRSYRAGTLKNSVRDNLKLSRAVKP